MLLRRLLEQKNKIEIKITYGSLLSSRARFKCLSNVLVCVLMCVSMFAGRSSAGYLIDNVFLKQKKNVPNITAHEPRKEPVERELDERSPSKPPIAFLFMLYKVTGPNYLEKEKERCGELRVAVDEFLREMQKLDKYNESVAQSHESVLNRLAFLFSTKPDFLKNLHPVLMDKYNSIRPLIRDRNSEEKELLAKIDRVKIAAFAETVALTDDYSRTVYQPFITESFKKAIEEYVASIEMGAKS